MSKSIGKKIVKALKQFNKDLKRGCLSGTRIVTMCRCARCRKKAKKLCRKI